MTSRPPGRARETRAVSHLRRTATARQVNERLVRLHAAQLAALLDAVAHDRVPPDQQAQELARAAEQLRELRACAEKAYPAFPSLRRWSAPR